MLHSGPLPSPFRHFYEVQNLLHHVTNVVAGEIAVLAILENLRGNGLRRCYRVER